MREADHHHAVDNLLPLNLIKAISFFENLFAEDVVNEISHHDIHIRFACGGESAILHVLLPCSEIGFL